MAKQTMLERLNARLGKLKKHEENIDLCYRRMFDLAVEWAKDHQSLQPVERDRFAFQIIKYIGRYPEGMRVSVIDVKVETDQIVMYTVGMEKKVFTDPTKAETYFITIFAKVINETAQVS